MRKNMKKMFTLTAALVMIMTYSLTAIAANSPSADAHESVETTVETVSPKTGEGDMLVYTSLSAAALAAVAAAAMKKAKQL